MSTVFKDYEYNEHGGECMGNFTMGDVALYATYVFKYDMYKDCEGMRVTNVRIIQVMYRGKDAVEFFNDNDVWTSDEDTILNDLEELM